MSNTNDKFYLEINWANLSEGFIQIPNEVLAIAKYRGVKFTSDHKMIYTYLANLDHRGLLNSRTARGLQSYDAIMHKFGIASKTTLSSKLQTLQELNLISKDEQENGSVNHYKIYPIDLSLVQYPANSHLADSYKNRRKAAKGEEIGKAKHKIAKEERFVQTLISNGYEDDAQRVEQRIEGLQQKRKTLNNEYVDIIKDRPERKPFSRKATTGSPDHVEPDWDNVPEIEHETPEPEQQKDVQEFVPKEPIPEVNDKPIESVDNIQVEDTTPLPATTEQIIKIIKANNFESSLTQWDVPRNPNLFKDFSTEELKEADKVYKESLPKCVDCQSRLHSDGTCTGEKDPDCGKMSCDDLPF